MSQDEIRSAERKFAGLRPTRREAMIKAGLTGATLGLFGLGGLSRSYMREACAQPRNTTTQKYDAVIQCFMTGGPSQTDTWDPKADPSSSGYQSPNNVFPTLSLGSNDIYGKPIWLTQNLQSLANLVNSDPSTYGLGVVRSMHHGNGSHAFAESFMNCYWQSPVANLYPATAASMTYLLQDQVAPPNGIGIPSCAILGNLGVQGNDAKGGPCPTALQVAGGDSALTVQMFEVPNDKTGSPLTQVRYNTRKTILQAIEQSYNASHPDVGVSAWSTAWNSAHDITLQGKAAAAFNLTGVTLLPGGPNARPADIENLTLVQQLVMSGIPFVAVGINGNDTHLNNFAGVQLNWADTVDTAFSQMAQNLKATGKRVLVTFFGEFGRTPNTVAPDAAGVRRDGRDHWPSGFSAALLSINQPAFTTTAVGDTGPDGMWTATSTTPLVDLVYPGALGGMIYGAMGYPPLTSLVPNAAGQNAPPVDPQYQDASRGNALWLAQQFGLS